MAYTEGKIHLPTPMSVLFLNIQRKPSETFNNGERLFIISFPRDLGFFGFFHRGFPSLLRLTHILRGGDKIQCLGVHLCLPGEVEADAAGSAYPGGPPLALSSGLADDLIP